MDARLRVLNSPHDPPGDPGGSRPDATESERYWKCLAEHEPRDGVK